MDIQLEAKVPYRVRRMTLADLKEVCRIDRDAFQAYRRARRQLTRPLRLRTSANMQTAIRRPYPGVVLEAPPGGPVVGYCFTHVWGKLGWLGTLGITPRRQGLGLGRAVIAGGLALLREAGCTTLALETMPESGKNLALYLSLGLEARYLTLLFRGMPPPAAKTHYRLWKGGVELQMIGAQMLHGFDPTPAAQWLENEGAGQTLVWWEAGRPVAFAALRHAERRLETPQYDLTTEVAACLPQAAEHWPRYLAEMGAYAQQMNRTGIVFPVNAKQQALVQHMLAAELRIVHTRVRMVTGAALGTEDALLMMTLAM